MARKKSLLSPAAKAAIKDAKYQQKLAQKALREQIREMRRYKRDLRSIDLRHKVSPQRAVHIGKLWQEYTELTTRPFKIFRTKNKKKLSLVQKASQHNPKVGKFDVAFVPVADPKAKIVVNKKGEVVVRTKYGNIKTVDFIIENLINDPDAEIERVIALHPKAKQFVIKMGKSLSKGGFARSLVKAEILRLMASYSPGGDMWDAKGPSHHWQHWLVGLEVFEGKNQQSREEYRREYHRTNEGVKKEKRKTRVARKKRYGRKF